MRRGELARKAELVRKELKRGPYRPQEPGRIIVCARPGCGNEVYKRASDLRKGARYCSRECWKADAAARRADQAKMTTAAAEVSRGRTGEGNPNYRHGRRVGANDRAGIRRFKSGQDRCVHPRCEHPRARAHEHHVIYEQKVRQEHGDRWDPRNALRLCASCHSSHHRRGSKIVPLKALRDENYEFAFELLGAAAFDYLRRRYSGDDPRLHVWLRRVEAAAVRSGDSHEEAGRAEGRAGYRPAGDGRGAERQEQG